ncbi:ribonuclease HII [Candidatus Kaiserbacteria bacterium]|nr:ribonuclease HII [Candidatus Kaiserbacteria bacterium]
MYIIGIDEAGRGPLAGPVSVGAVRIAADFDAELVAGAKDSKKMTPLARQRLYTQMCSLRASGALDFAVAFSDAVMIDREGIVPAVRSALESALEEVVGGCDGHHCTACNGAHRIHISPDVCDVRLDGGLKAPDHFKQQTTIIRGDQTELAISLASIAAKVERDLLMREIAEQFPAYGLEIHKGYGTALHRRLIREHGLSPIHRASFCTHITP